MTKTTIHTKLILTLNKAKKDSLAEYNLGSIAGAKGTKKEVKESAEKSGFTCK